MENKLNKPSDINKRSHSINSLTENGGLFFAIGFALACFVTIVAFEWKVQIAPPSIDITNPDQHEVIALKLLPAPAVPSPAIVPVNHQIKKANKYQKFESEEDFGQKLLPTPFVPTPAKELIIEEVKDVDLAVLSCDLPIPPEPIVGSPDPMISCGGNQVIKCILFIEQRPQPVGGYPAFYKYVRKNLVYPSQARRLGIEGSVFVKFIVTKEGYLTHFKVLKGVGAGCNEEAIRVLKTAPKWIPGKQRGVAVNTKFTIPIEFTLN
ncbi:energy transducer TonB [Microscilla marina]|uniref:TonB n=1 Tax=Microscilla marina ATCC 23134 TaxID=313606 RepID=A1ZKM0_MICM2|nr:energy transducer TonB [Microscilla marina]EAY29246.1 TonB [Microscilla marina ATCC 23134]